MIEGNKAHQQQNNQSSVFFSLPPGLDIVILSYLSIPDLIKCRTFSSRWKFLVDNIGVHILKDVKKKYFQANDKFVIFDESNGEYQLIQMIRFTTYDYNDEEGVIDKNNCHFIMTLTKRSVSL